MRRTQGTLGSEEGLIVRDDEHADGARITLEGEGVTAPFSITCGVYGTMFHTRFFGTLAEAEIEYGRMQLAISEVIVQLRREPDRVGEICSEFVRQFP